MSTPRGPADMAEATVPRPPELSVERVSELDDHDMAELCEATDAAIIEGGGFGWVEPQGRAALQRHFRGVLLVPEREPATTRRRPSAPRSPTPISPPMPAAMGWPAC
jgi:hypothetical protein